MSSEKQLQADWEQWQECYTILEDRVRHLEGSLKRIIAWPTRDESGNTLSISHGLLADLLRDILAPG